MGEERLFCLNCGKEISIKPYTLVSDIYMTEEGKALCQKCYRKYEKKKALNDEQAQFDKMLTDILPEEEEEEEKAEETVIMPERADYSILIEYCMAYAIVSGASDLHLKTGTAPMMRAFGEITQITDEILTPDEVFGFIKEESGEEVFQTQNKAIDFSFTYSGVRFRCNGYRDMRGWSVALRLLTIVSSDFAELGIPEILKTLAKKKAGLILITGPTGSGKTTTLTCLVDYLNGNQNSHIIMLEDPVEFVHSNKRSIISQREIGRDTESYSQAIVEAMREDPDIILVGEMRDRDSIEAALRAAETGHLVLSTLHTRGAGSSVDRIIDIFPPEQQNQIRTQLALCLLGVVSQQLIPGIKKSSRHLATEVMTNTPAIQNLIRQGKTHLITSTLQISKADGMYTMKSSLESLFFAGKITEENMELYTI